MCALERAPAVDYFYLGYSASGGAGPGAYNPNPDATHPSAPQYSMGKEKRIKLDKERVQGPGPLDYHPGYIKGSDPPHYSIPTAKRPKSTTDVPGPLHYYPEKSKNRDFKYSVPHQSREPKIDPENGPGRYTPNYDSVLQVPPSKSVGKAERFDDEFDENFEMGPGAYDINDDWEKPAPHYSFGRETQRPPMADNANPGPGEYPIKDLFDTNISKAKGCTISGKLIPDKHAIEATPAPSDYNPGLPQDKTLGGDIPKAQKHPESKEASATPAPNLYKPYVDLVTEHHPHFSFGTAKKMASPKDKGGNPTIYDITKPPGSSIP